MKKFFSRVLNSKQFVVIEQIITVAAAVVLFSTLGGKGLLWWMVAVILVAGIRLYRYRATIIPLYLSTCDYGASVLRGITHGRKKNKEADGKDADGKRKGTGKRSSSKKPVGLTNCTKKDAESLQQDLQQMPKESCHGQNECPKELLPEVQGKVQEDLYEK